MYLLTDIQTDGHTVYGQMVTLNGSDHFMKGHKKCSKNEVWS